MLVSGFHLEYTPGSNQVPAYTSGYQLEITNLSDKEIQFTVLARVTRYGFTVYGSPETPATILANLRELVRGVLKNDRVSWFEGDWIRVPDGYALQISIPVAAGSSELFEMMPSMFQSSGWWPRVTGHVELSIPAFRSTEPPYDWVPQTTGPVPVLLNPSTVEAWRMLGEGGGGDFTSSRCSPPLASGQAYSEITPDTHPELIVLVDP